MRPLKGRQSKDLERERDDVADAVADFLKAIDTHQGVPERYLDREVAVHLHMRLQARDHEGSPCDLCAVFQRLPEDILGLGPTDADIVRVYAEAP